MLSTGLVFLGGNTSQEKTVLPFPNSWAIFMVHTFFLGSF